MRILPAILVFSTILVSCSAGRKALSPEEYVAWYRSEKYPYRDTVVQNDVTFVLEGIPVALDLSRQLQAKKITGEELRAAYAEGKDAGLSYQLTVVLPGSGVDIYSFQPANTTDDFDRQHYFAFGMKEDLTAVSNATDSIDCSFFMQERLISNYPRARFTFGFGKDLAEKILYNDRVFTGQPVTFNLQPRPLPGLKTKSIK